MDAEELLDATLMASDDLVDLVTGSGGPRIGPKGGLPDDGVSAPAVEWERISTVPFDDLTAGGNIDAVRMQVGSWGNTEKQARDIASLVRQAITPDDATGIGSLDGKEGPSFDLETRTWGVRQDFIIMEERS